MAFIELPTGKTATGRTRELVLDAEKRWGFTPTIIRALALRPEVMDAEYVWTKALMWTGTLPRVLKEKVATAVSAANDCDYCSSMHALQIDANGAGAGESAACQRLDFANEPPEARAALAFAVKAARDMHSIKKSDVDALAKFYTPPQIVELSLVIGSFMMYNTFVTVLGFPMEADQAAPLPASK
jgi:uncharacterized peroxidase-related enzyme